MLSEITRIIQVDLDLKYKTNIRDLFDEFNNFPEGAVIGIAREMQPVYRYRPLPVGSREWAAGGWCLLFNSGCSSEKNLGSSGLPALIPAGGLNLKLLNWYEQSYSVAMVCLLVHKASRAKFLISAKIHVVHLEACLPIHVC